MNKINIYIFNLTNKYIILNIIFLTILILFINLLEISRILDKENSSFVTLIYLSILKIPSIISEIIPFVIIISIAFLFKNLISNNELISIRNVGLSILDIFKPMIISIIGFGIIILFLVNPIAAFGEKKFENITSKNSSNIYTIKFIDNGMWIKNIGKNNEKNFINISSINLKTMSAKQIKILHVNDENKKIIIAKTGQIINEYFKLNDVQILNINEDIIEKKDKYNFKLNFNKKNITDSLSNYKYIPFYKFNDHINTLKKFNLHSQEISLFYLSEILKPFFLVLIGFVIMGFSGKFKRSDNFFKVLFVAVLVGFFIFLFKEIVIAITNEINLSFWLSYLIIFSFPLFIGIYKISKIEND